MKNPNFFIVGAPKAGTTSMYNYIKEHPNVFMSEDKEPHYFSKDMVGLPEQEYSKEEYFKLFEGVNAHHQVVGEASTEYLISKEGIRNIRSFNPSSKLLVMLRNPVDLVYSWHYQMLKIGVQDVGDFQKAWHIQEVRANGEQIPQACEKPRRLQYRKIGSLGDHMERLLSYFPRNQVHWIFFDDFTNNTEKAYENLLDFLGLPSDGRSDFSVHNPNKQVKSHWFSNFIRTLPKTTPWKLWFWVKEKCNLPDLNFSGFLRSLNTEQKKRDSLSPEFRQHLVEVFRSDIRKLEDLLKTDLSHWARNSDE